MIASRVCLFCIIHLQDRAESGELNESQERFVWAPYVYTFMYVQRMYSLLAVRPQNNLAACSSSEMKEKKREQVISILN